MKLQVSYKRLWHLLIERDITRQEMRKMAGISSSTIAKIVKCENINTNILLRICEALNCDFSDMMEAAPVGTNVANEYAELNDDDDTD